MSSFPSPARPRPGLFPFGPIGLSPHRVGKVNVRVALVSPPTGRVSSPGIELRWAARTLFVSGPPISVLRWRVRAYRQARAPGHDHFAYDREPPYREVTRDLAPGVDFVLPSEEADRGYSTWEVRVEAYDASGARGGEVAIFALELGISTEPAEELEDLMYLAVASEIAVLPEVEGAIEAVPVEDTEVVDVARDVAPAEMLDPMQVG